MPRIKNSDKQKVILFFLDNPNSIDTPRGVATWTSLSLSDTRLILEDLAESGYLKAYRTTSTVGYSLTTNKKALKEISAQVKG